MLSFMTKSEPSPTAQFASVFAGAAVKVPTVPAPKAKAISAPKSNGSGAPPYQRKAKEARTVPVSLRMTPSVKSMADKMADDLEISLADVIHRALIAYHAQQASE
jgi:hypothetical protein